MSESSESTNQLLKDKYNLHNSPEVNAAATRTRLRTGERVPQYPLIRIQNYLDRLNNIINPPQLERHPGFDRKKRNLEMLKRNLYDRYVVKPDEIPESYWENQRRIARERGQAEDLKQEDWEELKRQNSEAIISDQESSLNKWIDYFASPDSSWIPDSLKYYAFRSLLNMGEYDKEKKIYPQRSKGTTKPFPDLNREALAYVLDALSKKYKGQQVDLSSFTAEDREKFEKHLQGENFAKLYAWAIEKVTPASPEQLTASLGKWVKYNQGSDHMPLVQSLQGHGTGWCTAGESTAQTQLKNGDFYVYYSLDSNGNPTFPRAAIRMEDQMIGEVRGIASEQNLDARIVPVVEKKLEEFPDGQLYKKRVHDMEFLTSIKHKLQSGQKLDREELVFLYEINFPIEGFGCSKDPRIAELRSQRTPEEDMPIGFDCEKNQIARNPREINDRTKAYVGPLKPGIFDLISRYNIEYVYTSFPEGKICRGSVKIGGKTARQLEDELRETGVNISSYAQSMLHNSDFTTLLNPEILKTVKLRVKDLGFKDRYPTTDQIYRRAQELGLELCPAETAIHLRLKDINQSKGEWYYIGMKQITASGGPPRVFLLGRDGSGLWLAAGAVPDREWRPGSGFVFRLRKQT